MKVGAESERGPLGELATPPRRQEEALGMNPWTGDGAGASLALVVLSVPALPLPLSPLRAKPSEHRRRFGSHFPNGDLLLQSKCCIWTQGRNG